MTRRSFLVRRFAGMVASVWVVTTLAFAYVVLTPGFSVGFDGATNQSVASQYVQWLAWVATLWNAPVTSKIAEAVAYTSVYLVPGIAFAVVVGTGIRVYTVASEESVFDDVTDGVAVLAVSVPTFLLAYTLRWWLLPYYFQLFDQVRIYDPTSGPFTVRNLKATVWPAVVMGVYLFAVQLRYAGEELDEYLSAEFVKTARAKGASVRRVGRHIFRNAAIPLLTLFFTDMLGMVVIGVFVVEFITHVPGVGELTQEAALAGDTRLLFSIALLAVLAGVLTNFAQDVAYAVFDPRVEFDE